MFIAQLSWAQILSGRVYDADDSSPIPFALIYLVEGDKGTLTDSTGAFTVATPALRSFHLRVEALGYESTEILVAGGSEFMAVRLIARHLDLHEVTVSGAIAQTQSENPFHIESRKLSDLTVIAAMNMGEAIARIPGVYQSSLGNGIAKPVVRGMQGMRVVTLMNGLRIESQQWGSDHGMGIAELGIGNVEIIKGPASLLYGADALAGVVYFNDAPHAALQTRELETQTLVQSNTQGITQRVMYRESRSKVRWQLGGSYASHADFKLPNGRFAGNSRFNETALKSVLSFNGKRSVHHLRYSFSHTNTGIPGESEDSLATPETFQVGEQNRKATLPAQFFTNHFLSADNKWFGERSELQLLAGMTSSQLQEYEEDFTSPGMSMGLTNMLYTLKWIHRTVGDRLKLIGGLQGMHQRNVNAPIASEQLVPDSRTLDQGAYLSLHYGNQPWNVQAGLRYDVRFLTAFPLSDQRLNRRYSGLNASAGAVYHREWATFRASFSSGFRAPHLTELLSNGFHHAALRYEIGNSDLKPEYARQLDITIELTGEHLVVVYNPFINSINDFIYLQPLGYTIEGMPAFAYTALSEVTYYGNDIGLHYHPHFAHDLHLETTWSYIQAQSPADSSVSMLPPQRFQTNVRYSFDATGFIRFKDVNLMHTFMGAQRNVANLESPSAAYQLIDVAVGFSIGSNADWDVRLGCKNMLNERYIDHLSRLKNIGMPAPGRNFYVSLNYRMHSPLTR